MVLNRINVGIMQVNCYIYGDKTNCIVIDPGANAEKILHEIHATGQNVQYIILTHCHFDHILAVEELLKNTDAKLIVAKKEVDNLVNPAINLCDRFSRQRPHLTPDITVEEGDVISVGNVALRVIETPGHTSGGICLFCESEKILFSGDTLFYRSIGRSDFPGGNEDMLHNSIRRKLFCLPNETIVYPGHGEETTIGDEKQKNSCVGGTNNL